MWKDRGVSERSSNERRPERRYAFTKEPVVIHSKANEPELYGYQHDRYIFTSTEDVSEPSLGRERILDRQPPGPKSLNDRDGFSRPVLCRKVDVRLPGKGNSNCHGAKPVHLIITMIKLIRTSRLSINHSLSVEWHGCVPGQDGSLQRSASGFPGGGFCAMVNLCRG